MPPLATIAIPVLSRSEVDANGLLKNGRASVKPIHRPRTYDDKPLPTKPSDLAPRSAQIVERNVDNGEVIYQVRVRDDEVVGVDLEEILEFVSPLDLEEFENRQFDQEREVLRVLEIEKQQAKAEKLQRMKERAKQKGIVSFEDVESTNADTEEGEVVLGKHGRARPTYKHLFKIPKKRQRRKRDPTTGELMSLSEDGDREQSSDIEPPVQREPFQPKATLTELPKRRRRKRDKLTGELLPLSPVAQQSTGLEKKKRQRRRRHPLTGELMPIGWTYNTDDFDDTDESRDTRLEPTSFRKLSISQEQSERHESKRPRLASESSVARSPSPLPTKAELAALTSPSAERTPRSTSGIPESRADVVKLLSSDEDEDVVSHSQLKGGLKPQPKALGSISDGNRMTHLTATSSAAESSPEPQLVVPSSRRTNGDSQKITPPSKQVSGATTSILHPSAARASSAEMIGQTSEPEEQSEEDASDDEWFIEAILAHNWSDPRTHPGYLGHDPVMLYQVKWEGYKEPTWEPVDSFGDRSVVNGYRKQVGLEPLTSDDEDDETDEEDLTVLPPAPVGQESQHLTSAQPDATQEDKESEGEDMDDEGYFNVEAILEHQLSDPQTHPSGLGKLPVMLYLTKWEGYDDPTWEPASSFEDQSILREYETRVGLNTTSNSNAKGKG